MKTIGIAYGFYRGTWIKHDTSHLFELLKSNFKTKNIEVEKIGLLDTAVIINNGQLDVVNLITGKSLKELSGIYFANWRKQPEFALAVAELMQRTNKPILSEEVLQVMPMTKLGEMVLLSDKNLPIPDSVFMRSKHWLKKIKNNEELPFAYPFIMKVIDGSMGVDNYLVNSKCQLKEILKHNSEMMFVAQEYIPNTHDYRVIIMGGEPKIIIKRSRQSNKTHLNNTSQGALGELLPLDKVEPAMLDLAIESAKAVRRPSFSGVDIIKHTNTGKLYVLEVNKTPQMETGTNTAEKVSTLVNYFATKIGSKNENDC